LRIEARTTPARRSCRRRPKAKLKSAFDRLAPALKASKDSPDLQLALADYYRAQRLPSSMNRYLANVKDDPRAALILGMAAAQEEMGHRRQFHC